VSQVTFPIARNGSFVPPKRRVIRSEQLDYYEGEE
jgi:hypothetical protein